MDGGVYGRRLHFEIVNDPQESYAHAAEFLEY